MSGSKSGFAISVGVVDEASKKLDAINKRIAAMNAPAEKFNKSVAKFGEVTGINKLGEGMLALGNNTLGAARAIEQMVSPMAAITSVASVAGIAALTKQWADAGNQISKAAYSLNAPVEKVSAFEGAARLAGSSAEAMDAGLQGLNESLNKATWAKDPQMIATLNQFDIGFKNADGSARSATDALGDVAEAVKSLPTPHAQETLLRQLGIPPDLLPLLKGGREGLEAFTKQAQQTGGVMSGEMAANATKVKTAWERMKLDLEGIGNNIANDWSGVVDRILEATSKLIEDHQEATKHIAEGAGIAAAIGAPAMTAWMIKHGWNKLLQKAAPEAAEVAKDATPAAEVTAAETAAGFGLGSILRYAGPVGAFVSGMWPKTIDAGGTEEQLLKKYRDAQGVLGGTSKPPLGDMLTGLADSQLGKLLQRGESGAAGYNAVNRGAAGNYAAGMENLVNKTVAEVMADQAAHKYNAAGRYQIIGPTLKSAVETLGLTGNEKFSASMQDRIFEQYLINSKRHEIADYIYGRSNDRHAALVGGSREWASIADPDTGLSHYGDVGHNKASITSNEYGAALDQLRAGHVHVTVDFRNTPPGTSAKAVASGKATVAAPRVETAMAGIG